MHSEYGLERSNSKLVVAIDQALATLDPVVEGAVVSQLYDWYDTMTRLDLHILGVQVQTLKSLLGLGSVGDDH